MSIPRPLRALAAVAIVTLALLGALDPASAASAKAGKSNRTAIYLTGGTNWSPRDDGAVVIGGHAEYYLWNRRQPDPTLFETVLAADDHSLPAEGECEDGTATVRVEDDRGLVFTLIGSGTVCGQVLTSPFSAVTHVFTGTYTVTESKDRKLRGTDGSIEVRFGRFGFARVTVLDS